MSSQEKTELSIASAIELSIELANEAAPIGKLSLCTTDVDQLIAKLAQLRAATMVPQIGRAPPEPADTVALVDPLWGPFVSQLRLMGSSSCYVTRGLGG
jgi:hypothetical protein